MISKSIPRLFLKGRGIYYFLIFILAGCGRQDFIVKETRTLMDTFCEISCYGTDRDSAAIAIDAAFKELERIERVLSRFDENSEVSRINNSAGLGKVKATKEVFDLTERAVYYSRISGGAFDITIAPLMEVWGFARRNKSVPDADTVDSVLKNVGYENIELRPGELSIRFLNKGTKLDFGGIAKGYAADRAKGVLVSYGIKNALVNLGGNIFALGSAPGERPWKIGIQDPLHNGRMLKSLKLTNRAISTSGNYERFFEISGRRYSHIINPVTGQPCEGIISVTVVADTAEEADALSTAIFVMGEKKGIELARSLKDMYVLILGEDGKIISYP